jgi:hypothetical protein
MTPADRYIRPQARSTALVLIDLQRDFLDLPGGDAPMPIAGTGAAIGGNCQVGESLPPARTPDRARRPALPAGRVERRSGSPVRD